MKLELIGMSKMIRVENHGPLKEGEQCNDSHHEMCLFAPNDTPNGCYTWTDATSERHLSISPPDLDYAELADILSRIAHKVPFADILKDPAPYEGKAFIELLTFSDKCDAIGTGIAAKLAQDFAVHKEAAESMSAENKDLFWFFNWYRQMEMVFQVGAKAGFVRMHLEKDVASVNVKVNDRHRVYEHRDTAVVRLLGPNAARVLGPVGDLKEGDIVILGHDPRENPETPTATTVAFQAMPKTSAIEFYTPEQRNRMIALAAVLGCDIEDIENPSEDNQRPGLILVAHDGSFDLTKIALEAHVSIEVDREEEWFPKDEEEEDDEEEEEEEA